MDKIMVFLIGQQLLFRQGIEHSFAKSADIEVVGTAEVSDRVLSNIDNLPPDIALVDVDGTNGEGIALARRIKQRSPSIGTIILTSNYNESELFQTLKAQSSAYLKKEITPEQLSEIIRRVARGEHPINESVVTQPKVAEQVLRQFQELSWQSETESLISPLTSRETEILNYIAQGYLNKQIAAALGISEQTIKNHVTSILRKLNANARTEAVVVAIKQGLITIS